MYDVEILMDHRPGVLAHMGETLAAADISVEGGGMFVVDGQAVAHFLFQDGPAAMAALRRAGLQVKGCRNVIVQRLAQDQPGQLGKLCREMADAGVNIEILYSDHNHQLILVVDAPEAARAVSARWQRDPAVEN